MTGSISFSCLMLALTATLLAGCGDKSQPPLEITTRAGGTFVLVRPAVGYQRMCNPGPYDTQRDLEKRGLRIRLDAKPRDGERPIWSVDRGSPTSEAVAWADIGDITFLDFAGDLNDSGFCSDPPDAVAADIHYRDGHRDRKNLIDTTDEGIEGLSERGEISIPIRNIARLRVIEDKNWDWVKKYPTDPLERDRARQKVVVKATTDAGEVFTLRSVTFYIANKEKLWAGRSLQLPNIGAKDFVVWLAGARVSLAWTDLKSVDIDRPDKLTARIAYADGRSDNAIVDEGTLNTTIGGEQSVKLANVKRIDVQRRGP